MGSGLAPKDENDSVSTDSVTVNGSGVSDSTEVTVEDVQETAQDSTEKFDGVTGDIPPDSTAPPRLAPIVWYEESQLTGDTITIFLEKKKLKTIDVVVQPSP